MAIEKIDQLEKELLVAKAQVSETKPAIKKLETERDECDRNYEAAVEESANAKNDRQKALQTLKRHQKLLDKSNEVFKTAHANFLQVEKELDHIRSERVHIWEDAEVEIRKVELSDRLREIENELEKLKEQDLANWASWPAEELVRRWENGDFDYGVLKTSKESGSIKSDNIKKLRAAYLEIKPQDAPSELLLFAISTQIITDEDCDTPWESSYWDPVYAVFPTPQDASDEGLSNDEVTNESVDDQQNADTTTSFTAAQTSLAHEDANCSSSLGKRSRESTTETYSTNYSLTESSERPSEGSINVPSIIKTEMTEEIKTDVDIVMKTEVDQQDGSAFKPQARLDLRHHLVTKDKFGIDVKAKVEEQDGPVIKTEQTKVELADKPFPTTNNNIAASTEVEVQPIIKDEAERQENVKQEREGDGSKSETDKKERMEKEISSASVPVFPGSYPASEVGTEERPAKRNRIEMPEAATGLTSNALGPYSSFDALPKLESTISEPEKDMRSSTLEPTAEGLGRLDSQSTQTNLDLDLEYAAAVQYLEFDD